MQLFWLCICSSRPFESTIENSHLRKLHTCKYCDFASVQAGNLRRHVKTNIWEKSHTCNYCDFASVQPGDLRRHMKTKISEKSHTCNYYDPASVQSGDLRRHVKTNVWENHTHATNVTLHLFNQAIWEDIWKSFYGKISHICNYCDFASVEAGDLRGHV